MTFQDFTTYEQSKALKELGLDQSERVDDSDSVRHFWYSPHDSDDSYMKLETPGEHGEFCSDGELLCRALSRQEIEDYLMDRYYVVVIGGGLGGWQWGYGVDVTLMVDSSIAPKPYGDAPDPGEVCGKEVFRTRASGRDPFPALYDALVGSLQQAQRPSPNTFTPMELNKNLPKLLDADYERRKRAASTPPPEA